ncbi:MAG: tetratricopeptide repeat protein [Pseudomonadales bacterium]
MQPCSARLQPGNYLRWLVAAALSALLPLAAHAANDSQAALNNGALDSDNPIVACYQSAYHASRSNQTGEFLSASQLQAGVGQCTAALRHYSMRKQARAQVYMHRGLLNRHLLHSDSALKDFQRAKRVNGDSAAISINIGNIHYLKGDFERAISAYNRALQTEFSGAHKALLNRGLASERLGRQQHAIDAYIAALALQPSLEVARERLSALTRSDKMVSAATRVGRERLLVARNY